MRVELESGVRYRALERKIPLASLFIFFLPPLKFRRVRALFRGVRCAVSLRVGRCTWCAPSSRVKAAGGVTSPLTPPGGALFGQSGGDRSSGGAPAALAPLGAAASLVAPILAHRPDRRRDVEGRERGGRSGRAINHPPSHSNLRFSGSGTAWPRSKTSVGEEV